MNQATLITPGTWNKMEQLEEPYIILDSAALNDNPLMTNLKKNYELKNHPKHGFNVLSPKKGSIIRQKRRTKRKLDDMWRESEPGYDGDETVNDNDGMVDDSQPPIETEDVDLGDLGDLGDFDDLQLNEDNAVITTGMSPPPPSTEQLQQPQHIDASCSPQSQLSQASGTLLPQQQQQSIASRGYRIIDAPPPIHKKEPKFEDNKNKLRAASASAESCILVGNVPAAGTFLMKKEKKDFKGKPNARKKRKGNMAYKEFDYVSSASTGKPALFLCDVEKVAALDS